MNFATVAKTDALLRYHTNTALLLCFVKASGTCVKQFKRIMRGPFIHLI